MLFSMTRRSAVDEGPWTGRCVARLGLLVAAAVLGLLAACGGGGSSEPTGSTAGVGSGGTGSYTSGPISGFGSVVVGGVHYEDAAAAVSDDDGTPLARDPQNDPLKLGMVVEIEASAVDAALNSAIAKSIRTRREIVGVVGAVDLPHKTLTVLGHVVQVSSATVFSSDYAQGLADVHAPTDAVAIYGYQDVSKNRYVATRVEKIVLASGAPYKLRGFVANLNLGGRTFTIDGQSFVWGSGVAPPADLANGQAVHLTLQAAVGGPWQVLSFGVVPKAEDADDAHLEGLVTSVTRTGPGNAVSRISVDGIDVDASGATVNASPALAMGVHVEVEGALRNGVLVAATIKTETENEVESAGLEVKGNYLAGSLNTIDKTFTLVSGTRSTVVGYGLVQPAFNTATLNAGGCVEVHGEPGLGDVQVQATEIEAHTQACGL